jgi:3-deoxy-D-manno-octulosonic-acid transferase
LGSSTWPGEEELLAGVVSELLAEGTSAKLLLVPRHAERGDEIAALLGRRGLPFSRRSTEGPADPANPVYLADTTGELREFTALADLAFVGKSLPPNEGGQTPIEAGGCGVPVVYGPRMSNFKAACQGLETAGAALRCADAEEVRATLLRLARDPEERARLSRRGREWHAANRGAVDRTVDAILAETGPSAGG